MHKLLNYTIQGEGFPVVFIHGFLEDLTMWRHMAPITGFQSICIDLPGHGLSEASEDLAIPSMATQVALLLDALNIDKFHVVGHSMGGYVGLELLSSDDRTQKLVLMNSNFWSDDEEKKNNRRARIPSSMELMSGLLLFMNTDYVPVWLGTGHPTDRHEIAIPCTR